MGTTRPGLWKLYQPLLVDLVKPVSNDFPAMLASIEFALYTGRALASADAQRIAAQAIVDANVVTGALSIDPANVIAGGYKGENDAATELVVNASGQVPTAMLGAQRARLTAASDPAALAAGRGYLLPSGARYRPTPRKDYLTAWGDSLTYGWPRPPFAADGSDAWPAALDAGWAGTVSNYSFQGQTADEVAIRQGGFVITSRDALTINGVNGASVTIPQTVAWRLDRDWSCPGYFDGHPEIAGTLTRAANTSNPNPGAQLIFTPAAAPDAPVTVLAGTPYVSAIRTDAAPGAVQVFFAGYNDVGYDSAAGDVVTRVIAAHAAMGRWADACGSQWLTLGTITSPEQTYGTPGYQAVTAINNALAAAFPDRYYDLRGWLVKDAITAMGLTPTQADKNAMAADTYPPQLRQEGVHYTPATAAAVGARLRTVIQQKGWAV